MGFTNKPGKIDAGNNLDGASVSNISSNRATNNQSNRTGRRLSFHSLTTIVMLFSLTFLTLAVIGFIMNYRDNDESQFIAKDKYQAVFMNNGQVYFGKIRELNNKYAGLNDIYYLRVNQQVQPKQSEQQSPQDISLMKLGCVELHKPQDQMIINRDQMLFWENIQSDGQVAKAIDSYKKSNTNGQCPDVKTENQPATNSNKQQSGDQTPTENVQQNQNQ